MYIEIIIIIVFLIILISLQFTLNKILMEIREIKRYLGMSLRNRDKRKE